MARLPIQCKSGGSARQNDLDYSAPSYMRFRGTQGEDQDNPTGSVFRGAFRFTQSSWTNASQLHWAQWGSRRQWHSLVLWRLGRRFYAHDSAPTTPLATYVFARRLGKESHATSSLPSLAVADCTWSLRIRRNRGMPGTTVPEGVRDQSRHRSAAHGAADAHRHGRLGGLCVAESSGSNDAMRQQLAERPPSNSGAGGHGWRWGSDVDGMAGNYLANVFIERSGRSLKYEAVYLAE